MALAGLTRHSGDSDGLVHILVPDRLFSKPNPAYVVQVMESLTFADFQAKWDSTESYCRITAAEMGRACPDASIDKMWTQLLQTISGWTGECWQERAQRVMAGGGVDATAEDVTAGNDTFLHALNDTFRYIAFQMFGRRHTGQERVINVTPLARRDIPDFIAAVYKSMASSPELASFRTTRLHAAVYQLLVTRAVQYALRVLGTTRISYNVAPDDNTFVSPAVQARQAAEQSNPRSQLAAAQEEIRLLRELIARERSAAVVAGERREGRGVEAAAAATTTGPSRPEQDRHYSSRASLSASSSHHYPPLDPRDSISQQQQQRRDSHHSRDSPEEAAVVVSDNKTHDDDDEDEDDENGGDSRSGGGDGSGDGATTHSSSRSSASDHDSGHSHSSDRVHDVDSGLRLI